MTETPFFSRRNQVYPVLWQGLPAVEKHFPVLSDWERERYMYAALNGAAALPPLYEAWPGRLVLGYLPHPTLLAELERQETGGYDPLPWQALGRLLILCAGRTGLLPREGNLRNYLWDAAAGQVYALDLEDYGPGGLAACGARLAAVILDYAPAETPVKQKAAAALAEALGAAAADIAGELASLRQRRGASRRERPALSGIILAGGASSRMGADKASLTLEGKTLLERQVDKMRCLGIRDILLSGAGLPQLPGTRAVVDEMPGQGPLGGLWTCLRAARNQACLLLSVDVPLVPCGTLDRLCRAHRGGVTALRRWEKAEPLIGVYDRSMAGPAGKLLAAGRRSVQALADVLPWAWFDYLGPEVYLRNCNTPQDIETVRALIETYAAVGLPLP